MMFNRLDSLILRRFPKKDHIWTPFAIHDGECVETLNLLVNSGCVERKAKVRWHVGSTPVLGFALLTGDWRALVKSQEVTGLGLDPSEFKSTFIRATPLGATLKPALFTADSLIDQFQAIEYIKNISSVGSIQLYLDDSLQTLASPHPFPIAQAQGVPTHNFDM